MEPILNGDTIIYGNADNILESLDYDFKQEKMFNYQGISKHKTIEQLAKFTSNIWQIHPFGEGNTITIAIFIIKYIYSLDIEINKNIFKTHSKCFRNALVRANYQNLEKGITYTMEFLNKFFSNLILSENSLLDNNEIKI